MCPFQRCLKGSIAAQRSTTPTSVAATPPCSTTPCQRQLWGHVLRAKSREHLTCRLSLTMGMWGSVPQPPKVPPIQQRTTAGAFSERPLLSLPLLTVPKPRHSHADTWSHGPISTCLRTVSCTIPSDESLKFSMDSLLRTQLTKQPPQSYCKGTFFVRVRFGGFPGMVTVEEVVRVRFCCLLCWKTNTGNTGRQYCWHQKPYIQKNIFWGLNLCNVIDYTYTMKSSREFIYEFNVM